jgi:hypothetical protein
MVGRVGRDARIFARQFQAASTLAKRSLEIAQHRADAKHVKPDYFGRITYDDVRAEARAGGIDPLSQAARFLTEHRDFFDTIDAGSAEAAHQPAWHDGFVGNADFGWWTNDQFPTTVDLGGQSFVLTKFLGAGWTASAFETQPVDGRSVLKIYNSERAWAVDDTTKSAQMLRHNERFVARFGLIVPDMVNVSGQGIFMNKMTGASIDSLGPDQRKVADTDVADLRAMLTELLPGRKLDLNDDNLIFDASTGKLTGWMDLFPGE